MLKKNKWILLITVALYTLMATMDGSIVNIAMPVLAKQLHVDMNQAEWIVSIYALTIVIFLLFFGHLGDLIGRIKIFRIGTFIFLLGSLLCGLSSSLEMLLLSRFVQAIGSSMTMSTNFAIVSEAFSGKDKGIAMGILASFVSLGNITGPIFGGIILSVATWHYIFLINLPIGIIAIVLGYLVFGKEKMKPHDYKLDFVGFILQAIAIGSFFIAIFYSQEAGFNMIIGILFVVTAIFLALFIKYETKREHPLLNLKIFKNIRFTSAISTTFLAYAGMFFFNIIMPFYLQRTLGLQPFNASIYMMGVPIAMVITSPISGHLSNKFGSDRLTFYGLLLLTLIQVWLMTLNQHTPEPLIFVLALLSGVGFGLFQSPNNVLVMSSPDPEYLGMAGSLNSFARNLGNIIGISLATSALFIGMSIFAGYTVTDYIDDRPDIFINGMSIAFIGSLLLYGGGATITLVRLIKDKKLKRKSLS